MFTQCPECETTYRLSSDDLSGAHGEVECGSCGKRFDALARLSMSLPMPVFQSDSEEAPPPFASGSGEERQEDQGEILDGDDGPVGSGETEGATGEQDAESENEPSGEEEPADIDGEHTDQDEIEDSVSTSSDEIVDDLAKPTETRTDGDEKTAHQPEENPGDKPGDKPGDEWDSEDSPDENIEHAPGDAAETEDTSNGNDERDFAGGEDSDDAEEDIDYDPSETVDLGEYDWQHTTVVQPQKPPPMEVRIQKVSDAGISRDPAEPENVPDYLAEKDAETSLEDNTAPSELTASKSAGRTGWLRWVILGVLIVIFLVWVHQARGMLARNSILRPALTGLYSAIGIDLEPAWDISQFAIVSSTASEARGGNLVVTVTYTNLADFPQPYPTLKVVLEDRWGESLNVRYFEPKEYLSGFVAGRAMRGGESATGETEIPSTGANAVGFNVDVCLKAETRSDARTETRGLQCASDL